MCEGRTKPPGTLVGGSLHAAPSACHACEPSTTVIFLESKYVRAATHHRTVRKHGVHVTVAGLDECEQPHSLHFTTQCSLHYKGPRQLRVHQASPPRALRPDSCRTSWTGPHVTATPAPHARAHSQVCRQARGTRAPCTPAGPTAGSMARLKPAHGKPEFVWCPVRPCVA